MKSYVLRRKEVVNYDIFVEVVNYDIFVKSVVNVLAGLDFYKLHFGMTDGCSCDHVYLSTYKEGVLHVEFYGASGKEFCFNNLADDCKPTKSLEHGKITLVLVTRSLDIRLSHALDGLDTLVGDYI